MIRWKSIVTDKANSDFLDGSTDNLEKHHIFGGANRKKSESDGLYVMLNHWNHNEPPNGVHYSKKLMHYFHQLGEVAWIFKQMKQDETLDFDTAKEMFRKRYGRNYL